MIKSFNRRKNISKRISAAQARTESRENRDASFDLRNALKAVGIKPLSRKKKYPWERTFHSQDASGTCVQGSHPEDWGFIDAESTFVDCSKPCKKLKEPKHSKD